MNLENYACHVAQPGGKVCQIAAKIYAQREAAQKARWDYATSKGATGLYSNDYAVNGLIFADERSVPDGWAVTQSGSDGIVAAPKAKGRTKAAREACQAIKAELGALPRLPGFDEFTQQIGGPQIYTASDDGRGLVKRRCAFERVGDALFVFTPWASKQDETGDLDDDTAKTAFQPEGCERTGLSRYYAAKEAVK